jgi:hypothetical protein
MRKIYMDKEELLNKAIEKEIPNLKQNSYGYYLEWYEFFDYEDVKFCKEEEYYDKPKEKEELLIGEELYIDGWIIKVKGESLELNHYVIEIVNIQLDKVLVRIKIPYDVDVFDEIIKHYI